MTYLDGVLIMRRPFATLALLAALGAAACSETPTETRPRLTPDGAGPLLSTALADHIQAMIDNLFPKGLETATEVRWETVKRDLAAPDPVQARKHLNDLVKWIQLKTNDITQPSGETKQQAAARLVLAMSIYVRDYPNGSVASVPTVGGDATFQVVPAGAEATVVTPAEKAGVHIETGSTNEDRIIVVAQDDTPYLKHCTGPLTTARCQYPLFYKFESFPNPPMSKRARFAVCFVTVGERRPLEYPLEGGGEDDAVHEHLRLAKPSPAAGHPQTDGSVIEGQIEILPLVTDRPQLSFTNCDRDIEYAASAQESTGFLARAQQALVAAVDFAGWLITPKDLYAYDSGPEHWGTFGSPFNAVCYANPDDPNEDAKVCRPDLSVASVSTASSTPFGGDPLSVTYRIENRSRRRGGESGAASAPTSATLYLSLDQSVDASDIVLATVPACVPPAAPPTSTCIPGLAPDDDQTLGQTITLPLVEGTRYVILSVAANPTLPEARATNNTASAQLVVVRKRADPEAGKILVYGPAAASAEFKERAIELGYLNIVVWSAAEWQAAAREDFESFDVIVVPSTAISSTEDRASLAAGKDNKWGPALDGNLVVTGLHADHVHDQQGTLKFLRNALRWAALAKGTGFLSLIDCRATPYDWKPSGAPWAGLSASSCVGADAVNIAVPEHPVIQGATNVLSNADLSNWLQSVHTYFPNHGSFTVVATASGGIGNVPANSPVLLVRSATNP